jgi:hypothetical protein
MAKATLYKYECIMTQFGTVKARSHYEAAEKFFGFKATGKYGEKAVVKDVRNLEIGGFDPAAGIVYFGAFLGKDIGRGQAEGSYQNEVGVLLVPEPA